MGNCCSCCGGKAASRSSTKRPSSPTETRQRYRKLDEASTPERLHRKEGERSTKTEHAKSQEMRHGKGLQKAPTLLSMSLVHDDMPVSTDTHGNGRESPQHHAAESNADPSAISTLEPMSPSEQPWNVNNVTPDDYKDDDEETIKVDEDRQSPWKENRRKRIRHRNKPEAIAMVNDSSRDQTDSTHFGEIQQPSSSAEVQLSSLDGVRQTVSNDHEEERQRGHSSSSQTASNGHVEERQRGQSASSQQLISIDDDDKSTDRSVSIPILPAPPVRQPANAQSSSKQSPSRPDSNQTSTGVSSPSGPTVIVSTVMEQRSADTGVGMETRSASRHETSSVDSTEAHDSFHESSITSTPGKSSLGTGSGHLDVGVKVDVDDDKLSLDSRTSFGPGQIVTSDMTTGQQIGELLISFQDRASLEINVREGRGLDCLERRYNSHDVYVKCYLEGKDGKHIKQRTAAVSPVANPKFHETLSFKPPWKGKQLRIMIWTDIRLGRNLILGHAAVDLATIDLSQKEQGWYVLFADEKQSLRPSESASSLSSFGGGTSPLFKRHGPGRKSKH